MKRPNLSHYAMSSCATAALLAGCGGSQPPIGAPGAMSLSSKPSARANSTNYKVVYSFGTVPDGSYPTASLIDLGGTLYGTTAGGGSNSCGYYSYSPYSGCGTVYSITRSGTEKVLYRFGTAPNGSIPRASLLDVRGTLYGTTAYGGSYTCGFHDQLSCGTVFSITTSGVEKMLHGFGNGYDGEYPLAALIKVKGTLYGTTSGGGANYCFYTANILCGTVFSITPGGTEKVLYSFSPGRHDANTPGGSLVDVGGKLYGTTRYGGKHGERPGYGTVFSITLGGTLKVLHSFSGTDGRNPSASLIDVSGTLYGTTESGGANNSCDGGCGTVFSITPSGTEKVLHSFSGGSDGYFPVASLIDVNGTLYGTTSSGGHAFGTVFSITTSGAEQVLHSFGTSSSDGRSPYAGLINVNGTLYGTTYSGGANDTGTVFSLTP